MPITDSNKAITEIPEELLGNVPQDLSNNGIGLTSEEKKDPNAITVTIADNINPIIVLFGPPACGKTMTLIRLTRFLQAKGYGVKPIRTFRPATDADYQRNCENFNSIVNDSNAAQSTDLISFMLVEVVKNGKRICQILEAPGEHYFNLNLPNIGFPNYVNTIINGSNRKIWTIFVEPDWLDQKDRLNYVDRITYLKTRMRAHDSVVFVFNKIDKTHFVRGIGNINTSAAIKDVQNLYPKIFVPFLNQNPISKYWKAYNCEFVPFQTGDYTEHPSGTSYQEGPEEYCVRLWSTLEKQIKG